MIQQALCNSYKLEAMSGVHQPGDVYKIALYTSAASINKNTTAYTASGEVPDGGGYSAGGIVLVGLVITLDGDVAILDFTTDPVWPAATITARGALIYNASQGDKAIGVLDFGHDVVSTDGPFTVTLPPPAAATALIAFA